MSSSRYLTFTRRVKAPREEAFRAFTHATLLRDWLCDVTSVKGKLGGHLFLNWIDGGTVVGTYTRFERPDAVAFTWDASFEPEPCTVEVTFQEEGQHTRVTLTHGPVGEGSDWQEAEKGLNAHWPEMLENLASVLETGIDLRFARRPRLGILIDDFTPEAAKALGVPVNVGVLLNGTAEGTGARAAGLQKGDVLVELNGVALTAYDAFNEALKGLKAGDKPEVVFYRGAEKQTVPLELSSIQILEVPAAVAELAAKVRRLNGEIKTALIGQLEGLSEEQSAVRPAEAEWSVRELIAHFILMERDYQSWVADMLNDTPVEDDLRMRPNVTPRIAALLQRYGTLAALRAEMDIAQEETAVMIEAFPQAFVEQRKHLYRRAAEWVLEVVPNHDYNEHRDQIAKTVAAAQGG